MSRLGRFIPVLMLSTALAAPVSAAEVNNAQAVLLENQLREWLGAFAIPGLPLSKRPVQLMAEGDHYLASIPIGTENPVSVTATLTPQSGDRWKIENFRFPSPATITINVPTPDKKDDGTQAAETITYRVTMGDQEGSGLFDPTFRTESTFRSSYKDLAVQTDVGGVQQNSRVAQASSQTVIRPAGEGRVDITSKGLFEGYVATTNLTADMKLNIEAAKAEFDSIMSGIARDKAYDLTRSLIAAIGALMAKTTPNRPATPADIDPAIVRKMLAALQGFGSEVKFDESFGGLRLRVGEIGGDLESTRFGMAAAAPNGMLQAEFDFGMDGLKLVNVPLGPFEAFVPRRFILSPTVSGIATADLYALANEALETKGQVPPSPQTISRLFSHGGIVIGLKTMSFDVAEANFSGLGTFRMLTPVRTEGEGQIKATNLDALIDRIKGVPSMAQVLPAIVFAKGIGRSSGGATVWNISFKNNKLLVNDTDLSALAGRK